MSEQLSSHHESEQSADQALEDIEPISEQDGEVYSQEELQRFVEAPALPTCEKLFELGIVTTASSANKNNAEASIVLDYDSLSDENKEVVRMLGLQISEPNERSIHRKVSITAPISESTSVSELQEQLLEQARKFHHQEFPQPIGFTARDQFRNMLDREPRPDEIESFTKTLQADPSLLYNDSLQAFFHRNEVERYLASQERVKQSQTEDDKLQP